MCGRSPLRLAWATDDGERRCRNAATARNPVSAESAPKPWVSVVIEATVATRSGPPASPSSRPSSAEPMVCPRRSTGVVAASAAKPSGVISPLPAPISTAARRMPVSPGSIAQARPAVVIDSPAARPVRVVRRPSSRARPARGWTTAAQPASTDTAAPVATVPSPAARPETGRNPTSTDRAAASAAVGVRKTGSASRRARSRTVCRVLGSGGTRGTASPAQTATAAPISPKVGRSRRSSTRGQGPAPHRRV